VTTLAFDRARLDVLRLGIGAALDDLNRIRCDEAAADDVMRNIRVATRTLGDLWLPRVQDVVNSKALISCIRRKNADGSDVAEAPGYASLHGGMETIDDLSPMPGPPAPHHGRTFDEVVSAVRSGAMLPMTAPIDAHGRAGARYESLSFAPTAKPVLVGVDDRTSNFLKVVDFFSDGVPVGWHENQTVSVYYLADARVTSSVHVLTAYDPDQGPETLLDLTTQATVSGYLIIRSDESVAEVTMKIGADEDDDATKAVVLARQTSEAYSGMFFPDEIPDLQPVARGPRVESPDVWTFTTSASPMVDGWGTWQR
jgi:hypothetical protein